MVISVDRRLLTTTVMLARIYWWGVGLPSCTEICDRGVAIKQLAMRIRLKYGKNFGPVREIRAGGGYRSPDSATQILGIGQELPDGLTVAWPSGKTTEIFIPELRRKYRFRRAKDESFAWGVFTLFCFCCFVGRVLAAERNQGKSWSASKLLVPRFGAPGFKQAATGIDFQSFGQRAIHS